MPLKLMYITNRPDVAKIAEENGVDRIFVDMEYIGKAERQQPFFPIRRSWIRGAHGGAVSQVRLPVFTAAQDNAFHLTGFRQKSVILGAPGTADFDASAVWGPLMGFRADAGLRITIWKTN